MFRAPVIIEEFMKIDDFYRLSVSCPTEMTALHSDLSADLGCWRDISIYAHALVSGHIEEMRDILMLCWCPDVVACPP